MAKRTCYPECNFHRCCNCYKGLTDETRVTTHCHKNNNRSKIYFAYYCKKCHEKIFNKEEKIK